MRTRQRVVDYGEVFTPQWMVEAMLDLVRTETCRIDSRILEPACGSGNFLIRVLMRKLAAVEARYGRSDFEKRHHALLGLMCVYGIELLEDNVTECRQHMLTVFSEYLNLQAHDVLHQAATKVLVANVVHGDALSMLASSGDPITFAEWGYLGRGKFQRRDFRFANLTQMSSFDSDTLFGDLGKHELFTPVKSYVPMSIAQLAA
jgi:hypothetical protein